MTERPTARQIVRDDAQAFGWDRASTKLFDVFTNGGRTVTMMWSDKDPARLARCALLFHGDSDPYVSDTTPLCIVSCREWLRGSMDLLAPAPARACEV